MTLAIAFSVYLSENAKIPSMPSLAWSFWRYFEISIPSVTEHPVIVDIFGKFCEICSVWYDIKYALNYEKLAKTAKNVYQRFSQHSATTKITGYMTKKVKNNKNVKNHYLN